MSVFSDNPITTSPTTSKHRSGFCFDLRMKSLSISTSFRQLVAKSGPCTLPRDLAEVSIGFPYDGFISIATRRFWHGEINGRALKPGILRSENMWPWTCLPQVPQLWALSSGAGFNQKNTKNKGQVQVGLGNTKQHSFWCLVGNGEWSIIIINIYKHSSCSPIRY